MKSDDERPSALGQCLRRMETSVEMLDGISDEKVRSIARELLEASLDLHGLALARLIAIGQGGGDGAAIISRFVADEYVAAVMLLHGLHPDEAEVRLRRKLASMRSHWGVRGFRVDLLGVDGACANVGVRFGDDRSDRTAIRREIEDALTEAAPDLDRIIVEDFDVATTSGLRVPVANAAEL